MGQLLQTWAETEHDGTTAAGEDGGLQSYVQTADGATVPVDTDGVAGVPVDSTIAVTVDGSTDSATGGVTTGDAGDQPALPVLDSTVVTKAPPTPPVPTGRLTNQVTVVTALPVGSTPDGTTAAQVADLVNHEVADFWSAQTDGAVRIGVVKTVDAVRTTAGCAQLRDALERGRRQGEVHRGCRQASAGVPSPGHSAAVSTRSPRSAGRPPPAAGSTSATPPPRSSRTSSATTSASGTRRAASATRPSTTAAAAPLPTATSTTSWASAGASSVP